jgi:putative acetyltransferase
MMRAKITCDLTIDEAFIAELYRENVEARTRFSRSHSCKVNVSLGQNGMSMQCNGFARIRRSRASDVERVVDIWRGAVDATHHFLTTTDRQDIEVEVAAFLPKVFLWLAVDSTDRAIGFMLLNGSCMEALFIHPQHRGSGVGRALIQHALTFHSRITTEVNEQNLQAVGFYEHLGFEQIGYAARDQQGRPYPLIRLRKSRGIE